MPPKKRRRKPSSSTTPLNSGSTVTTSGVNPDHIEIIAQAAATYLNNVALTEAEDDVRDRQLAERMAREKEALQEEERIECALFAQRTAKKANLTKARNWFIGLCCVFVAGVFGKELVSKYVIKHEHGLRNSVIGKLMGKSADQMMKTVDLKNRGILYKYGTKAVLVEPVKDIDCFQAARTKAKADGKNSDDPALPPEWKASFPQGTVVTYWGYTSDDQPDGTIRVRVQEPFKDSSPNYGYNNMCSFFAPPSSLVDITKFKPDANKTPRPVAYPESAKRPKQTPQPAAKSDEPGFKG